MKILFSLMDGMSRFTRTDARTPSLGLQGAWNQETAIRRRHRRRCFSGLQGPLGPLLLNVQRS